MAIECLAKLSYDLILYSAEINLPPKLTFKRTHHMRRKTTWIDNLKSGEVICNV